MFLDVRCPGCDTPRFSLPRPICAVCERLFGWSCPLEVPEIVEGVAGALHQGKPRNVVLAGKGGGRSAVFTQLGVSFSRTQLAQRWAAECSAVTWVPASTEKSRNRGFDQGDVFARSIGQQLGFRPTRMLVRVGKHRQTGRSRAERSLGPQIRGCVESPESVLLVDDVVTTGASVLSAASALRTSGATSVYVVAITNRKNSDNYALL